MTQACYMYSHQYFIWSTHIRVKKIVPHDNVNIVIQAVNKDFYYYYLLFKKSISIAKKNVTIINNHYSLTGYYVSALSLKIRM